MEEQKRLSEEQNKNDVKKFNSDEGLMVSLDSVDKCEHKETKYLDCDRCKVFHKECINVCVECHEEVKNE